MATPATKHHSPFPGIDDRIIDSLRSLTAVGILVRLAHQPPDSRGLTLDDLAAHPNDASQDVVAGLKQLIGRGLVTESTDGGTTTYSAAAGLGGDA